MREADLDEHSKSIIRGSRSLKEAVLKEPDAGLRLDMLEALWEQTWAFMGNHVLIAKDERRLTEQRNAAELVARLLEAIAVDIARERDMLRPRP